MNTYHIIEKQDNVRDPAILMIDGYSTNTIIIREVESNINVYVYLNISESEIKMTSDISTIKPFAVFEGTKEGLRAAKVLARNTYLLNKNRIPLVVREEQQMNLPF